MPQASLQEITTSTPTASLSDIFKTRNPRGTASLNDIAGPKVLSLVGIASTIKEP
jgi:hypothetical protein